MHRYGTACAQMTKNEEMGCRGARRGGDALLNRCSSFSVFHYDFFKKIAAIQSPLKCALSSYALTQR